MPYLCEVLEMTPGELAALEWEEIEYLRAWQEGRSLGEWVAQNPRGAKTHGRG